MQENEKYNDRAAHKTIYMYIKLKKQLQLCLPDKIQMSRLQ